MAWVSSTLHTFVNYVVFGTTLAFVLSVLFFKALPERDALTRTKLMLVTLGVPIGAYLVIHVLLPQVEPVHLNANLRFSFAGISSLLCLVGLWGSRTIIPIVLLVLGIVVGKGFLRHLSARHIVSKYEYALPVDYPVLHRLLAGVSASLEINPPRLVVTSTPVPQSMTFGTVRPVVVVSQGLLDCLEEEELEAVLAHEVAHIRQKGYFYGCVANVLRDLTFFNPVSFIALGIFMREREKAADDMAVAATGKPLVYAATLIKVWRGMRRALAEVQQPWNRELTVSGIPFVEASGLLADRIERVLSPASSVKPGVLSRVYLGAAAAGIGYVLSYIC
ncbi:MAG: M56 family metallopeptidase [Bacillota bacterium]